MINYLEPVDGSLEIAIGGERRSLPLVLAGPILRRTVEDSVTVWVALQQSREVVLRVYDSGHDLVMEGRRETSRLGEFLHVVAVEATPTGGSLHPGEVYQYNLEFVGSGPDETLNDDGVVTTADYATELTYGRDGRPSFVLPPGNINDVRLVHGSCRKPHGEGHDALPAVDRMIESTYDEPTARPQQLFLTGDQIYADDVADALLAMLTDAANTLLGREEAFDIGTEDGPVTKKLSDLPPGNRQWFAENHCQFSSGHAKSHLLGLGEYYAMYLFAWSDVLWPSGETITDHVLPSALPEVEEPSEHGETNRLRTFLHSLENEGVRRALANIPTYMIFDDHEVTDDWYLHRQWCDDIVRSAVGKRVLKNAHVAYAVFQAWGNTPDQFRGSDAPGTVLLDGITRIPDIGGPIDGDQTGVADGVLRIPSTGGGGLDWGWSPQFTWHYDLEFDAHEVIVLDTRTHRGFPDGTEEPARLIDTPSFDVQFPDPNSDVDVSIVVSPCPPLDPPTVAAGQKMEWIRPGGGPLLADVEHWHHQHESLQRLFSWIARRQPEDDDGTEDDNSGIHSEFYYTDAVVLAGDVHYGYTVRTQQQAEYLLGVHDSTGSSIEESDPIMATTVIANLTASACKNESLSTRYLHNTGYSGRPLEVPIGPVSTGKNALRGVRRILAQNEVPPIVWGLGYVSSDREMRQEFESIEELSVHVKHDPLFVSFSASDKYVVNEAYANVVDELVRPSIQGVDWLQRSHFIIDKRSLSPASSSTGGSTIAAPGPGTIRAEDIARYLARAVDWDVGGYTLQTTDDQGNVKFGGAGKDIAGRNNVGEVWFEGFNEDDGKGFVVHELWWRMRSKDGGVLPPFPLTKHVVSLDRDAIPWIDSSSEGG